ncbi:periplasmic chaperone LolA [Enterobacter cloacae]|nr:periplasmic chaperone LolA [Enterobacter cloacae]
MLIARNQSSDWQQYNIKQNGDEFVLTPKGSNGNLKQFTINVSSNGTINQFGAVEQDEIHLYPAAGRNGGRPTQ